MKTATPALDRGIDVIELLAFHQGSLSFSDILDGLPIPRASLARILASLRRRGLVEKSPHNGRYRLGLKLIYLTNRMQDKIELRSVALPVMRSLCRELGETIELSTRDRDQLVLIEQVQGEGEVRLYSRVGAAYPYFHATAVGKIYLAHMEPQKRKNAWDAMGLPKVTAWTVTNRRRLEKEVRLALENGYAVEDQELRKGVRRVAAPIFDHRKQLAGCLGLAAPSFRLPVAGLEAMGRRVNRAAERISGLMQGGDWPQAPGAPGPASEQRPSASTAA